MTESTFSTSFPGQQEGERVLYVVEPHPIGMYLSFARVLVIGLVLFFSFAMMRSLHPILLVFGVILSLAVVVIGLLISHILNEKRVAYITDRRIVRFEPSNPFAVNSRALSWDDTVKVKTYPPNVIYRMMNVGNVTIHASSTIINVDSAMQKNTVNNDDLDLTDVYYYKDLGNYLDKILYMNKHQQSELASLRPFVPKPKGQRY